MVNRWGKLDSRERQGCSFEFCPPSSQTNLHNTFQYPLQLVVSNFSRVQLCNQYAQSVVKDTAPLFLVFQSFLHANEGLIYPR